MTRRRPKLTQGYEYRLLKQATRAQLAGDFTTATRIYVRLSHATEPTIRDRAVMNAAILGYQLISLLPDPGKRAEALDHSISLMQTLCHRRPNYADGWYNLGCMLYERGSDPEAEAAYRRAVRCRAGFAAALNNLGAVLMNGGKHAEALDAYGQAVVSQDHSTPESVWNRSLLLLLLGQYAEGWKDYEVRWRMPIWMAENGRVDLRQPFWEGQVAHDKRVLVFAEQGFGDAIMMLRFWPQVRAKVGTLLWEVPIGLRDLWRQALPPDVEVVVRGDDVPPHDLCVPVMSLPYRCGLARPADVPPAPYLRVTPHRPEGATPRIGFVWRGAAGHRNDRRRSTRLAQWADLLAMPGIQWVSLSVQTTPEEDHLLATIPGLERLPQEPSFLQTAEVVAGLDLVIAVDTSIVHLAGALGTPVWVLLAASPDYRWGLGTRTTPWYSSALLFRQTRDGEWASVLDEVRRALAAGFTSEAAA